MPGALEPESDARELLGVLMLLYPHCFGPRLEGKSSKNMSRNRDAEVAQQRHGGCSDVAMVRHMGKSR